MEEMLIHWTYEVKHDDDERISDFYRAQTAISIQILEIWLGGYCFHGYIKKKGVRHATVAHTPTRDNDAAQLTSQPFFFVRKLDYFYNHKDSRQMETINRSEMKRWFERCNLIFWPTLVENSGPKRMHVTASTDTTNFSHFYRCIQCFSAKQTIDWWSVLINTSLKLLLT